MEPFNFSKLIVNRHNTILECLDIINKGSCQVALVLDEHGKLEGVISDGDIRRSILRAPHLSEKAEQIMNRNFISLKKGANSKEALTLFKNKPYIHHLPVLDENNLLVDLFIIDNLLVSSKEYLNTPVIIMAGGRGERLRPITDNIPKPMLHVEGKPILEVIINRLKSQGFHNIILVVNYLKEQIISYFGDGKIFDVNIEYIIENTPLGTAGGISELKKFSSEEYLITNADVLTEVNYGNILQTYKKNKPDILVSSVEHKYKVPYGVIEHKKGKITKLEEKPTVTFQTNAAIYIVKKNVLPLIPKNEFFNMTDLVEVAIEKKLNVQLFPIIERWTDIGLPWDLQEIKKNTKGLFDE